MTRLTTNLTLASLFALAGAAPAALCQEAKPSARVDKLTEWPELKKSARDRARAVAKQLRKKPEEVRAAAVDKLAAMGAGVAPVLIPLVSDRPQSANEQLFEVLDRVTDGRLAALLGRVAQRKTVA